MKFYYFLVTVVLSNISISECFDFRPNLQQPQPPRMVNFFTQGYPISQLPPELLSQFVRDNSQESSIFTGQRSIMPRSPFQRGISNSFEIMYNQMESIKGEGRSPKIRRSFQPQTSPNFLNSTEFSAVDPVEFVQKPAPKLPEGFSFCDQSGNLKKSKLESPISLGRPSKWKISKLGLGAGRTIPNQGQRIATNRYYGRILDKFYMQNDGYNLIFYANDKNGGYSDYILKVKEWDDEYVFAKGILHWGDHNSYGSEHTLHGQRFPLEIQLIHYKSSLGKLEKAAKVKNGVMIASILFEFAGFNKEYLMPIVRQASAIAVPGPIQEFHGPLQISQLFPSSLEYYEYMGSFSTEPCGSEVRRIVFAHTSKIGRDQLRFLRMFLRRSDGTKMANNFRKLQSTKNREIIFNSISGSLDVLDRDSVMRDPPKSHW